MNARPLVGVLVSVCSLGVAVAVAVPALAVVVPRLGAPVPVAPAPAPRAAVPAPADLPGIELGKAPWPAEWPHLAARLKAIGLPALSREGTALHMHQHLDIWVRGARVPVPTGLGFGVGSDKKVHFVAPIHTHDETGVIHIESPEQRPFTLGQVFDVWGLRFDRSCLGGSCAAGAARLRLYVNGKAVPGDPRALKLAPYQEIVVVLGTPGEALKRVPATFAFDPGL